MQPVQPTAIGRATVWIVEDNPEFRSTVQELVDSAEDLSAPHTFSSGEELFEFLNNNFAPDLILFDIGLPGMSGIDAVGRIREIARDTQMVMLTIHEDNDRIFEAICAGACGYLTKVATPEEILRSIREALRGGAPMTPQIARRVLNLFTQVRAPKYDYDLTDRERDVLRELVDGGTKKQMGKSLFVSEHTVDTHLRNIYTKLHVHSRSAAVVKAVKENLISPVGEG